MNYANITITVVIDILMLFSEMEEKMLCWLTGLTDRVHSANYKGPEKGSRDLMSKHRHRHPLATASCFPHIPRKQIFSNHD